MGQKRPHSLSNLFVLSLAVFVGGGVRLSQVIPLDFPLNDGALFAQMTQDLLANQFRLPQFTTYNQAQIPYAYPPLGFYITAALHQIGQVEVVQLIQYLPALISILTIPAFWLLARQMLKTPHWVYFATFGFALAPTAFDWLIVGGGLTRSLGYLFAILCLTQTYNLFQNGKPKNLVLTVIFASLTVLSHPGTTWFTLYSALIFFLFWPSRKNLRHAAMVAAGTLTLTVPWWLKVAQTHGIAVLGHPFQTEGLSAISILTPFTFLATNEPLFDLIAMAGFLGLIISLRDRKFFLPAWFFGVFVFEARLGAVYSVIPFLSLAGLGIDRGILQLTTRSDEHKKFNRLAIGVLIFMFSYATTAAFLAPQYQSVSQEQRTTLAWIAKNTPAKAQFLVITGRPAYGIDAVAEWFPVLSQRANLSVPQGYEWLPNRVFSSRVTQHAALQTCAAQGLNCINRFAAENQLSVDYIYLAESFSVLQNELAASGQYDLRHTSDGGQVWEKR